MLLYANPTQSVTAATTQKVGAVTEELGTSFMRFFF